MPLGKMGMRRETMRRLTVFRLTLIVVLPIMLPLPAAAGKVVLKVGGVGSALGLMRKAGALINASNPDVALEVLPSLGSAGAIKAVAHGALDIGLIGRPLKPEEDTLGLNVVEFAKTPFVFIVHKDVHLSNVSRKDLVDLLSGASTSWPGGGRIRFVLRPPNDSDTLIVKAISPEIAAAMDVALAKDGMVKPLTDQETADVVEKASGAISFSTLTQIITEERPLTVLSFENVAPTLATLDSRKYPLYKPLYFVTAKNPAGPVRIVLEFMTSVPGAELLEGTGNLPVK